MGPRMPVKERRKIDLNQSKMNLEKHLLIKITGLLKIIIQVLLTISHFEDHFKPHQLSGKDTLIKLRHSHYMQSYIHITQEETKNHVKKRVNWSASCAPIRHAK